MKRSLAKWLRLSSSIRGKIIFWYASALFLILVLFGTGVYLFVETVMLRSVNRYLELRAANINDSLFSFWRAIQVAAPGGPGNWISAPPRNFVQMTRGPEFKDLVRKWGEKTDILKSDDITAIVNHGGTIVAESALFAKLRDKTPALSKLNQRTHFSYIYLDHQWCRLICYPARAEKGLLYYILVAVSLEEQERTLKLIFLAMVTLIPLTVILSSAVGLFLASRTLQPVADIIKKARNISAVNLNERIRIPRTDDELAQLARTFNVMLDRIERGFMRLRQFSAAASHELRTPLTIMKGEFELAVRKTRSTVEYQKIIKDQIIILDELTTIVKYLLSLTRSETTGGNPQFVIMDLNDVIADIKNTWEPEVGKKGGILSVKTVPSVSARLEPVLFKRIIANLIENALRHIPENNGRIDLTLFRVPQAIRISVADNGCGIPPDQRRTLFDRFFSNAYKNSSPDSIGLGLGLCRWIAEIHEGHITLDEKYRGGARFVITIPAA